MIVWRIEKFVVMPWPKKMRGKFYTGDSYIVLHTYHAKGRGGREGGLRWDVHFWIGDESSQDEYGAAAYKAVELDDFLGGAATQYREVQGNESAKFRSLFKHVTYMEGGIESGFTHVEATSYPKRLLWVKGSMNTVVRQVPLSWESMNSGDSFILDTGEPVGDAGETDGTRLLAFHGSSSSPMEKVKAAGVLAAIDEERGGVAQRETFMEDQPELQLTPWWEAIGGAPPPGQHIKTADAGGSDAAVHVAEKVLLRVTDARSGKVAMSEVARGDGISRALCTSDDVFVLDDAYEVMVWIGKDASRLERTAALELGQQYLNGTSQPDRPIVKLLEGGENEQFEAAFEVGVMSTARPGDGVRFSGDMDKIRGLQRSKAAAASTLATYEGSGGPGVAIDFDALYAQPSAVPSEWRGRSARPSEYATELADASKPAAPGEVRPRLAKGVPPSDAITRNHASAYDADNGWLGTLAFSQQESRSQRIMAFGKKYMAYTRGAGAEHAGTSLVLIGHEVEPALRPAPTFDAEADAATIRTAIKGLGTDRMAIVNVLALRSLGQRLAIRKTYEKIYERSLLADFDAEWLVHGALCKLLKFMCRDPYERDAHALWKAMHGGLIKDSALIREILCTKETAELELVAQAYTLEASRRSKSPESPTLAEDVAANFSGDGGTLLAAIAGGSRPAPAPIDIALVAEDAQRLYEAGEKKTFGTDEAVFIEIFSSRSFGHIGAIEEAYRRIAPRKRKPRTLERAISKEMSGMIKRACKTVLAIACDPTGYWTARLHKSLVGQAIGRHNASVIRIMVDRAEVDLTTIEAAYSLAHGTALPNDIGTGSTYSRCLLTLLNNRALGDYDYSS